MINFDGVDKQAIDERLSAIFDSLKQSRPEKCYGVLDGLSGSVLFFALYYKYSGRDDVFEALNDSLDILFEQLPAVTNPTLCMGSSGICWLLRMLQKENLLDADDIDDALSEVDAYIDRLFDLLFCNDIDYLHGGMGISFYYLFCRPESSRSHIDLFFEKLLSKKQDREDGGCMWITRENDGKQDLDVINLGLSHGMASTIVFLSKYYELTHNPKAKETLYQAIRFYKSNENPPEFKSMFRPWIIPGQEDEYRESRLAWCYGDLGIAAAINYSSRVFEDKELFDYSVSIVDKTTRRFSDTLISEETFCHGSCGASYLYRHFYKLTGKEEYRLAAQHWLDRTMAGIQDLDARLPGNHEDVSPNSVLGGLAGVGLSLLSFASGKDEWGELLLLI